MFTAHFPPSTGLLVLTTVWALTFFCFKFLIHENENPGKASSGQWFERMTGVSQRLGRTRSQKFQHLFQRFYHHQHHQEIYLKFHNYCIQFWNIYKNIISKVKIFLDIFPPWLVHHPQGTFTGLASIFPNLVVLSYISTSQSFPLTLCFWDLAIFL